jgi:hypothetical protein
MHIKLSRNKKKSVWLIDINKVFLWLHISNCHSCSTRHFLLKFMYTVWILSGNVYMSYMYRFYLYISFYFTIYLSHRDHSFRKYF